MQPEVAGAEASTPPERASQNTITRFAARFGENRRRLLFLFTAAGRPVSPLAWPSRRQPLREVLVVGMRYELPLPSPASNMQMKRGPTHIPGVANAWKESGKAGHARRDLRLNEASRAPLLSTPLRSVLRSAGVAGAAGVV